MRALTRSVARPYLTIRCRATHHYGGGSIATSPRTPPPQTPSPSPLPVISQVWMPLDVEEKKLSATDPLDASGTCKSTRNAELWTRKLPASVRNVFVQRGLALARNGVSDMQQILTASFPYPSDLEHTHRKDELECMMLDAALHDKLSPAQLFPLCPVTTNQPDAVPYALLQRRRAVLFRIFCALLEAGRLRDAAVILRDARLRPSQPKHMLRMLLRQLDPHRHACLPSPASSMPTLCKDPAQSSHAALREACNSWEYVAQRDGQLNTQIFVYMLEQLLHRYMHSDMLQWVTCSASMVHDANDQDSAFLVSLSAIIHRMTLVHHVPAQAATLMFKFPTAWRTYSMYHDLLSYKNEECDPAVVNVPCRSESAGSPRVLDYSWRKRLWDDMLTHAHLQNTSEEVYLAHLGAHAHGARVQKAWVDWKALRQLDDVSQPSLAHAALLLVRAFVRSGRTSLAMRFLERHASFACRLHGTEILNTLLQGVVDEVCEDMGAQDRAWILSRMYECVWLTAKRSLTPTTLKPSSDSAIMRQRTAETSILPPAHHQARARASSLLKRMANLFDTHSMSPNLATLQILVRTATKWDTSLDSHALWHMAALALPYTHTHSTYARTRSARCSLYAELASALQQRHEAKSARRALSLLRKSRRRIVQQAKKAARHAST